MNDPRVGGDAKASEVQKHVDEDGKKLPFYVHFSNVKVSIFSDLSFYTHR